MNEISKVNFLLENCEEIEISGKYIKKIDMENNRVVMAGIGKKEKTFDQFYIEILSEADRINIPFGIEKLKTKTTIFDRLSYGDISQIEITDKKGIKNLFYVPYDDLKENQLGTPNINQHTKVENSNLHIAICKQRKVIK